jgi:autotransporter-associated beta strand protein
MLTVGLVRAQPASDSIVCADFDRAGWYTLPTLNLGGATTIEGWVYLNSYTSWSRLADLGNGSDSDNILVVLDNGFPKFQIYSGSTSVRTLEISPQVPLGIWTHVAAVIQDDRTLLLYTNGVLAGSTTASDLPASTARTSNFIGKSNWPADALLDGSVTDVRIWNVARSQAEVQAAMAVGAITGATTGLVAAYPMGSTGVGPLADISGHGYTATAGGSIASYTKLGAGALTNSGVFSGTGGLNVLQGTLTLSGANTYTGGTIVSGGTLLVNGSLAAASTVTVGTGAALGGTGTIGGAVIVNAGGTLAPGADAPGTLTLNSSLTLAGTASFRLRKSGATLTGAQVAGATSVIVGDTLIVTASGDSLVSGDSFTLFNVTPSGSFAATNLPALTTGLCWTTPDNFRTLTVSKGTPVVTAWPAASAVTYGQTLASSTLTGGSATTAGSFAWTAPSTAPNAGTAAQGVTFTPIDAADYTTVTGTVSVTVNRATPMVTALPTASPITYGQTLANSTLSGGSAMTAGSFAWTTSSTAPSVGTTSQGVTFIPTDTANYTTVSGTVSVTVNQATPTVIAWPTASPINYGQTLANSTLSGGSATTEGSFGWIAPDTVPALGSIPQAVVFTPTDTMDYTTVTYAVLVTVIPAVPGVVANWTFNGTLNDSSGNNNTLAPLYGSVSYADGPFAGQQALYLDGSTVLATASGVFPAGVPTGSNPYTVALMVKADPNTHRGGGMIGYGNNSYSQGENIRLNGTTSGIWDYWFGNDFGGSLPSGGDFTVGWHRVINTWDGVTENLYLDEFLAATRTPSPPNIGTDLFYIGKTTFDANLTGWLADVLIANYAVSPAQVLTYSTSGVFSLPTPPLSNALGWHGIFGGGGSGQADGWSVRGTIGQPLATGFDTSVVAGFWSKDLTTNISITVIPQVVLGSQIGSPDLNAGSFLNGSSDQFGIANITPPAGSGVSLRFSGQPGSSYRLERSFDLSVWKVIWTTNAPANGAFFYTDSFLDLKGQTPAAVFYRLVKNSP